MNYATAAPATSNGQGNSPPVCQNCGTGTTPLWRRDESGSVLCNACGLFLKLHGRPRPISLKTDVIKSRNRVKATGQGQKKKDMGGVNSLAAAHPDLGLPSSAGVYRGPTARISSGLSDRSISPVSRAGTPGIHHASNIAPQHMFDGVTFDGTAFHSPSLSNLAHLRQPSPSASSVNGLEAPMTYDALVNHNSTLKTRVNELEVINDLFRGRVSQLEISEADVRRGLEQANKRESDMKRRIEELENELSEYRDPGLRHKRVKMSDIIDESQTSTPLTTPTLS